MAAPQAPVTDPAGAIVEELPTAPVDLVELPAPPAMLHSLAEGMARPGERPAEPSRVPVARPLPPPRPREAPAAPPREAPDLEARTEGQVEFLATLTDEKRACFEQLPPRLQARFLGYHRDGLNPDRIMAKEVDQALDRANRPSGGPLATPIPDSPLEAWERLAGGPMHWIPRLVAGLVQCFGRAEDRAMIPAFTRLANDVQSGRLPAEDVVEPLRKALKPGVRNRGAIFNVELKPRLRDRGYEWDWGKL